MLPTDAPTTLDVGCRVLVVECFPDFHARLSFAYPPRTPAFRPPSGTREVFGGNLALRSHHGNLCAAAANHGALAARRHGDAPDAHAHAHLVRDAARSVVAGSVCAPPGRTD